MFLLLLLHLLSVPALGVMHLLPVCVLLSLYHQGGLLAHFKPPLLLLQQRLAPLLLTAACRLQEPLHACALLHAGIVHAFKTLLQPSGNRRFLLALELICTRLLPQGRHFDLHVQLPFLFIQEGVRQLLAASLAGLKLLLQLAALLLQGIAHAFKRRHSRRVVFLDRYELFLQRARAHRQRPHVFAHRWNAVDNCRDVNSRMQSQEHQVSRVHPLSHLSRPLSGQRVHPSHGMQVCMRPSERAQLMSLACGMVCVQ